jgi:hypothetical protein
MIRTRQFWTNPLFHLRTRPPDAGLNSGAADDAAEAAVAVAPALVAWCTPAARVVTAAASTGGLVAV